ncbi:MAG: ATP synthase F1 subunit epsilon [Rhodospirillales bacterium]
MAETVEFELVSPAKLLMSEDVEMVVVPGMDGDIGVLPGHSLLITTVRPGVIDVHEGGKVKDSIFVGGGFCEVSPERCTVLAEEAMPVDSIDKGEADARLSAAQEALSSAGEDDKEAAETELKLAEALVAAAKA